MYNRVHSTTKNWSEQHQFLLVDYIQCKPITCLNQQTACSSSLAAEQKDTSQESDLRPEIVYLTYTNAYANPYQDAAHQHPNEWSWPEYRVYIYILAKRCYFSAYYMKFTKFPSISELIVEKKKKEDLPRQLIVKWQPCTPRSAFWKDRWSHFVLCIKIHVISSDHHYQIHVRMSSTTPNEPD
jgi:hypothetical protein